MAKRSIKPIMSLDDQKFMAFEGLVQWTKAVVNQSKRVSAARNYLSSKAVFDNWSTEGRAALHAYHCECHYFVIAAYKIIEHHEWVQCLQLVNTINFSEIESFDWADIKDLRNMREHIVDYFKGEGNAPQRWIARTLKCGETDASSMFGSMIGGRLDYIKFSEAAERLLSQLLALPILYPSHGMTP